MFFCLSCNLCASFSLLDNFWTLENCNCTPEILNTARYFCVWNCDLRSNKKSRARNRRNANRRSFYWDGWPHTRQRHSFFHPHCMVSVPYSSLNFYLTLVIQSRDLFFSFGFFFLEKTRPLLLLSIPDSGAAAVYTIHLYSVAQGKRLKYPKITRSPL